VREGRFYLFIDMMNRLLKQLKRLVYILLPIIGGGMAGVSCSENDATVNEYENWQARNDAFFASLEDSLANGSGKWMKIKSYSKNPSLTVGNNTDCIYVRILENHDAVETESPLTNDSVRVSYQGRLMPTKQPINGTSFEDGKVFDSTVYGVYNIKTNATARFKVSAMIPGFTTALLKMKKGDTWLVYIPYALAYGSSASGSVPAYSTLIFKMTLYDYAAEGVALQNM
jgi:FKBP-type peptidyl-prolyl cis-trans isomerase FklB